MTSRPCRRRNVDGSPCRNRTAGVDCGSHPPPFTTPTTGRTVPRAVTTDPFDRDQLGGNDRPDPTIDPDGWEHHIAMAAAIAHDEHSSPDHRTVCLMVSTDLAGDLGRGAEVVRGFHRGVLHAWVAVDGHIIDATVDQFGDGDHLHITGDTDPAYVPFTDAQERYVDLLGSSRLDEVRIDDVLHATDDDVERIRDEIDRRRAAGQVW